MPLFLLLVPVSEGLAPRDLIQGDKIVAIPSWTGKDDHVIDRVGSAQGTILRCALEYFSNKPTGSRRDELEAEMFKQICILRIYDALSDKIPAPSKIEHDIAELSKKIDDNNELLTRVTGILTEVLKRLDSKQQDFMSFLQSSDVSS